MNLTDDQKEIIRNQVAVHTNYMLDFEWSQDYKFVKLWDPETKSLILPSDWKRRTNDILAATYIHSLAIYANNGDDCLDEYGNTYEVKLTYIHSKDYLVSPRDALMQKNQNPNTPLSKLRGIGQACRTKFKVYPGTDKNHHNKTTAYVLMSGDHNCYITGYIMTGDKVSQILHSSSSSCVERPITLSKFQIDGHEITSSVPRIGWDAYVHSLRNYIKARDNVITGSERDAAIDAWVNLLPVKSS